MCGIGGIVTRAAPDPGRLRRMAAALAHRGPDGEGVRVLAPANPTPGGWHAGLVHRRLAVFDPTPSGAQPMASRSGRTHLVLNGEIYNHVELRRWLPGFPWRTRTDTEVLVELLELEGLALLSRLNGIFALAAWQPEANRLLLARDRLGVKPLVYRADPSGVSFASELRALLEAADVPRRLDRTALSEYLDFGFAPAPRTMIEGVRKLEPGTWLEWQSGSVRSRAWWTLPESSRAPRPEAGWREGLYERLHDAVRLQLRSDVPVGCFLSGGLDSTLVTALAVRERGPLDSFSACFPEHPALDEGRFARAAARCLGTRHHEVSIRGEDVRRAIPELLGRLDEPLGDSSLLAVFELSRVTRGAVAVALSGDGGDELFGGYRRYAAEGWLARWRRLPAPVRRALAGALTRLREDRSTRVGDWIRRARKLLDADTLDPDARAFALACVFRAAEKARVAPGLEADAEAGLALLRARRAELAGRDALETQLRVDLRLGLPDDMLTKVDRGSMAHGLEVRVPLLDHRLVEHAARLPSACKRRRGRGKRALLDVFGAHLPRRVRARGKRGFDAPLGPWLRGALRDWVHEVLAPARVRSLAWLDADAVGALVGAHERGESDHAWRLWSLVVLVDWASRHRVA